MFNGIDQKTIPKKKALYIVYGELTLDLGRRIFREQVSRISIQRNVDGTHRLAWRVFTYNGYIYRLSIKV